MIIKKIHYFRLQILQKNQPKIAISNKESKRIKLKKRILVLRVKILTMTKFFFKFINSTYLFDFYVLFN
jgi:hypothetical protein